VQALAHPERAVGPALTEATGTTGGAIRAREQRATAWPWLAVVGGLVSAGCGAVGLTRAGRWPGPARRYEAAPESGAGPAAGADTALDDWNALSRGEDPTR
jgi:Tryptophan-associated transmembrane protein (Trp_oprn_chp)